MEDMKMNGMRTRIGMGILLLTSLLQFGHTTTMVRMNLRGLTDHADLIAIGRISELNMVLRDGQTWTVATVLVEQAIKGKPASVIYFQIPGGTRTVEGRTLVTVVDGTPAISSMQKAVLFLNGKAPEYYDLTGWEQGYRHVQNQNGQEIVSLSSESPERKKLMPLRVFVNQIREYMKEGSR